MAENYKFSQLDITERFNDRTNLKSEVWIRTVPLISTIDPIEGIKMGLMSPEAPDEQIYDKAVNMSRIREGMGNSEDGVYCPICHHANMDIKKLGTPCPTCGRPLLRFGWD
jgi:hypothetical protein